MRQFVVIVIFLSTSFVSAFSQEEPYSRITAWDFSLTTGGIFGGPCQPMQERLLHYGIGIEWDTKIINYLPVVFEADWAINKYLRLGLNISFLHQDLVDILHFNTKSLSGLLSYNYRNLVFISAGPALNAISYFHPTNSSFTDGRDFIKPGFILKSHMEFPRKTRLHLRLEIQYNYGSEIDPVYTIVGIGTSQYASRSVRLDDFPVNYFYAGIGFGVRLYRK